MLSGRDEINYDSHRTFGNIVGIQLNLLLTSKTTYNNKCYKERFKRKAKSLFEQSQRVMLSETKHLTRRATRCFVSLSMTLLNLTLDSIWLERDKFG